MAAIELAARGWILTYDIGKGVRRSARPVRDPKGAVKRYEDLMRLSREKGTISATEALALDKIKMDTQQPETSALSHVPK